MIMKKIPLKTIATYAGPMLLAALVRLVLHSHWVDSPFHLYHTLVGLDMRKFLVWGVGLAEGTDRFTMYRFLVALASRLANPANLADAVVITQLALGVATTGLTVFIFRKLFKNRAHAVLAGVFFAAYAPPMVYETQILKETLYLFLTTLSLASAINAVAKRSGAIRFFACGTASILPFLTRFSGILWFTSVCVWVSSAASKKGESLKSLFLIASGAVATLAAVFAFEAAHGRYPTPFFTPNAAYVLKVGAKPVLSDLSLPSTVSGENIKEEYPVARYVAKIPYILSGSEMPNNVNYYFERLKLPPLRFALPPAVLVPAGLAGLLLMLFLPAFRGRAAPFLWLLFSFAAPMLLFVPLARYKLIFAPTFCVSASFLLMILFREIRGRNWSAVGGILGVSFLFGFYSAAFAPAPIIRDCDLKAYAIAATRNPVALMRRGAFKEAREILRELDAENVENPYIRVEYASSCLGSGAPRFAYFVLKGSAVPDDHPLAARWRFETAESLRLQRWGDARIAKFYREALRLGIGGRRRKAAESWLRSLPTHSPSSSGASKPR
jgi:hypothetical protein